MKATGGLFLIALVAVVAAIGYFSFLTTVPPGMVGVKVYLLGTYKGVDSVELPTGRYWVGWNEQVFLFPTFTQNYTWTHDTAEGTDHDESFTFQSTEGMSVNADIGISYHIDAGKVTGIFQKYRRGINEITDVYLRNMVRDALTERASQMKIDDIYGSGKAELMASVLKTVRDEVGPIGINVEKIYWIGTIRLPKEVITSLNNKIRATQEAERVQNEVAQAKAEADKTVAEAEGKARSILAVATAQAKANEILSKSLTPELVQYKSVERWNGELPRMTGQGAIPFIQLNETTTPKSNN